jgi:hypothetical protein
MIAGIFALAYIAYYGSQLYAEVQHSHFDEEQVRWGVLFFGLLVIVVYLRAISWKLSVLIAQQWRAR